MGEDTSPIINGFRIRCPKALAALYDDYGSALYGYVFKIVGDRLAAEAILELTFREIWTRSYKQVQNDEELRLLAFWLGRRKALEHQRGGASVAAACHEWLNKDDAMQAAISRLSGEDRALLKSIYFDHHTLSEIARLSGMPRGEIRLRVAAVFKILRGVRDATFRARTDEANPLIAPRP